MLARELVIGAELGEDADHRPADQVAALGVVASAIASWSASSAAAKSPASQAANAASSRGSPASSPFGRREPGAGRKALGAKVSPQRLEQLQRRVRFAAGEQQLAEPGCRVAVARVELERLAQRVLVARRGELVGRRGDERVEPAPRSAPAGSRR